MPSLVIVNNSERLKINFFSQKLVVDFLYIQGKSQKPVTVFWID